MNSKLRSSLVGLSALALVLTGTLHAPSQAAKKLPENMYHTIQLDGSSNSKLNATQITSFRKKLVRASHLSRVDCTIRHAESISSGNLAKVTRAAQTACQSARKVNSNLKFAGISFFESSRLKGTKFQLELFIFAPRVVTFRNTYGINVALPSNSKILKFNAAYRIPAAPSTIVSDGDFVSWNTQEDGRGKDYQPGQNIRVKHSLELFPKYVGYTINFNIESLNMEVGSNYQLLYHSVGNVPQIGDVYERPVFSNSQPAFATKARSLITIYVPGFLQNVSAFTVTQGLSVEYAGGGTCPDISAVADACSAFTITYTTSGTVTFDYNSYLP